MKVSTSNLKNQTKNLQKTIVLDGQKKKKKNNVVEIRNYYAILKDFGALSYGLAGVMDNRIGVVLDSASEVVLVPNLHGFAHSRSQPRHFLSRLQKIRTEY